METLLKFKEEDQKERESNQKKKKKTFISINLPEEKRETLIPIKHPGRSPKAPKLLGFLNKKEVGNIKVGKYETPVEFSKDLAEHILQRKRKKQTVPSNFTFEAKPLNTSIE